MSFAQFEKWLTAFGFERAGLPHAPRELAGRQAFYMPVVGDTRPLPPGGGDRTDDLRMRVVMTTPALDRQGDIVVPSGVRLKWFRRNPVALWAHRYDLPPIGVIDVDTINVTDKGIEAEALFDHGSVAGREVYGLYERGVLRAWSIGFIPLKWEVIEDEHGKVTGYRIVEWELLEVSAVPVPANPEALTRQIAEMESRRGPAPRGGADDSLAPVLHALKGAVAGQPEADSVAQSDAPLAQLTNELNRQRERFGALRSRHAALEDRIAVLETAESERQQTAQREQEERRTASVGAIADRIRATLVRAVPAMVADEFDRLRGAV